MNDDKKLVIDVIEENNISIIKISGFLDANTAPSLEQMIDSILKENKFKIIVDFEKLDYISSAGLGVFMSQIEEIRENKGDLKLCNMQQKVYSVFELLGFPMLFEICDNINECIKKFENG